MSGKTTHTFTAPELYLLAAAFGGEVLFGLQEKAIYQLKGDGAFQEAYQRLIDKEILTTEGKITRGGAFIIQAVELYHQSKKYVRINNIMFAFQEKNQDELILLIEKEESEQYQLRVLSKAIVLKMLSDEIPLILREPKEEEKSFLKQELLHQERREIEEYEPEKMFMNLELFHLEEEPKDKTNSKYYQQWFIFTKDEKLIMLDIVNKNYYHASQYWFLKILFDEMDFPYKRSEEYV